MNEEMKKMVKTAKGLDIFFAVLFWIMVVASVILVLVCIGAGFVLASDEGIITSLDLSNLNFTTNGLSVSLKDAVVSVEKFRNVLFATGGMIAVAVLFAGWMIRIVRGILAPMKQGRPFEESISQKFRKLGILVIVWGITGMVAKYIISTLFNSCVKDLLISNGLSITATWEFDLSYVVIAFLLFLFSYIFKYGEQLQTQVDETL